MWIFQNTEDLSNFKNLQGEGIVSLYLDDGLDAEKLAAIHDAKENFDKLVGARWHLLLPHKSGGVTPEFWADPEQYDTDACREISDQLDVSGVDLPALVFTDPDNSQAILIINLGRLSREQVIQKIRDIANIINRPREQSYSDAFGFRNEVVAEIKASELNDPTVSVVSRLFSGIVRPAIRILLNG